MRERIKTLLCIAVIVICLPVIITMIFQGESILPDLEQDNQKIESSEQEEEMLAAFVSILASEMPVSYEREALRAQAVLVRTNYYYAKASGQEPEQGLSTPELMALLHHLLQYIRRSSKKHQPGGVKI